MWDPSNSAHFLPKVDHNVYALEFGTTSRNVGNAKLIITSTMEEVESLRNTRRLDFKQIANVPDVDNIDSKNTFNGLFDLKSFKFEFERIWKLLFTRVRGHSSRLTRAWRWLRIVEGDKPV